MFSLQYRVSSICRAPSRGVISMNEFIDIAFFLVPFLFLFVLFAFRRLSDEQIEVGLAENLAVKNGVSYWGKYKS
jgi:hypothetical protein